MAVNRVKITNDIELKDRLVAINRVTKVTKGGRTFTFAAIVVVGNENGVIGWGLGKAGEVTAAIAKGVEAAKKNLVRVPVLKGTIPHEVEVYEINGPFFFGVATKFDEMMSNIKDKPQIRIIRMRRVPFVDSTGLHNLETLIASSRKEGIDVILSGVNPNVHTTLVNAGIDKIIGEDHIHDHINKALDKAREIIRK